MKKFIFIVIVSALFSSAQASKKSLESGTFGSLKKGVAPKNFDELWHAYELYLVANVGLEGNGSKIGLCCQFY
jgi:hypothetical protein